MKSSHECVIQENETFNIIMFLNMGLRTQITVTSFFKQLSFKEMSPIIFS